MKRSKPDSDRDEEEDHEVLFPPRKHDTEIIPSSPGRVLEVPDWDVANMVRTLNGAIAAVSQDNARLQRAYQQLCTDNIAQDKADLNAMVREYGSSPAATQRYDPPHRPVDLVRRCRRMYWMRMGTYVPLTLASHGRITKNSCMVSGWSDLNSRDRQDRNRSCPHHIQGWKRRSKFFIHDHSATFTGNT